MGTGSAVILDHYFLSSFPLDPTPTCLTSRWLTPEDQYLSAFPTFVSVLERREGTAARSAGEVGRNPRSGSHTCKENKHCAFSKMTCRSPTFNTETQDVVTELTVLKS